MDILGDREEALKLYREIGEMQGIGANLRKAAVKGLKHPYREKQIKEHDIDFVFSDNTIY